MASIGAARKEKKMYLSEKDLNYILAGLESIEIFPDEQTKKEVERLISKEENEIKQISEKYKCDVKVTCIGTLTPPKEEQEINVEYHSKEMISTIINEWKDKEREAFTNGRG